MAYYLMASLGKRAVGVKEKSFILIGREKSGSNRVDSDADGRKVNSHKLREV